MRLERSKGSNQAMHGYFFFKKKRMEILSCNQILVG